MLARGRLRIAIGGLLATAVAVGVTVVDRGVVVAAGVFVGLGVCVFVAVGVVVDVGVGVRTTVGAGVGTAAKLPEKDRAAKVTFPVAGSAYLARVSAPLERGSRMR